MMCYISCFIHHSTNSRIRWYYSDVKKTPLRRRTPLRSKNHICVAGHSDTAEIKERIQALLRAIVIARDKGCILRDVRHCNGLPDIPGVVLQADHLITRANSATFADTRLVVCVCRPCHAWKSLGSNQRKAEYDALVRTLLPADRVALWDRCEQDSWRPHRTFMSDWTLAEVVLEREFARLRG